MDYKGKTSHVDRWQQLRCPEATMLNTFFAHFEYNTEPLTRLTIKDCGLSSVADVRHLSVLNPRKAADPDDIPSRILRACTDQLAGVLTDIFNFSLSQSAVPTSLFLYPRSKGNWTKWLRLCSTHFCHHVLWETSQGSYHLYLTWHTRSTSICLLPH
jgi:hypothetical protein